MPKGEPRSVPDPLGPAYDEMIRRELSNRLTARADYPPATDVAKALAAVPFKSPLDVLREASRLSSTVKIGGQTYREFDNGRANVLLPVRDTEATLAARSDNREALERVQYIADHPLGGVGYSVATLAGASTATQDKALMAGGALDNLAFAAAATSAAIPRAPTPAP